jgi:hypothetical protein
VQEGVIHVHISSIGKCADRDGEGARSKRFGEQSLAMLSITAQEENDNKSESEIQPFKG